MLLSVYRIATQGTYLQQILMGLMVSMRIALIALGFSTIFGSAFGFVRLSQRKWIKILSQFYLETFRIVPILVWLFIGYFGLARIFYVNISGELVCIVVFTLWGTAELGEVLRASVTSLPVHQTDSAKSIGMTKHQIFRYILLPQALKRSLPGTINLATRMIKTTSLAVMVGVVEVIKVGRQMIEVTTIKEPMAPFWIYAFIASLYFIICFPLTGLSKRLEQEV